MIGLVVNDLFRKVSFQDYLYDTLHTSRFSGSTSHWLNAQYISLGVDIHGSMRDFHFICSVFFYSLRDPGLSGRIDFLWTFQ